MKSFVIMGCGKLGKIVAEAYKNGLLEGYELTGAYSRSFEDAKALVSGTKGRAVATKDELLSLEADYLVEAASIALLKEVAVMALKAGTSIIPLSIGAFADRGFYEDVLSACSAGHSKVLIPGGAVGGFDVLNTITLMAQTSGEAVKAGIHTHKGPASLRSTSLYSEELTDKEKTVFKGTTSQAISLLPTKVNVAVASALATVGPDNASAAITSVPGFIGDDHCIELETKGLKATVDIYSATSDIAGWSVVALMRNLVSPIQFY